MTPGPYEARHAPGIPTDCCDFGVISLSAGREICRVWERDDAEQLAKVLNENERLRTTLHAVLSDLEHHENYGHGSIDLSAWPAAIRDALGIAANEQPTTGSCK